MHVDRVSRARGHADDLARPDGHERLAADAARCRLGRARHYGRRHAARYRRRATDDGAAGVAGRRGYRLDTAGHRPDRRPQGPQHVHEGQCAGARDSREHELFPVPALRRAQRYLLAWRRPPRGGAARRRFLGRGAARSRDPRNFRRGPPDHRVAAGFALRADLPRHRRPGLGKSLGRIHRTALSGAVSLGGVLAAISAPLIGPLLDRRGSRLVLCAAVLVNGIAMLLLSATGSLLHFYLLFCLARMNWAGPFDLGIYGALSNWFVRRRTFATSIATLAQQAGLVAMPLLAQFAILQQGWRAGWLAIGAATLLIGFVPAWLLLVRRPEDLGLSPDGRQEAGDRSAADERLLAAEPAFSRREALDTPAFWLVLLYTALVFPVQAGVSLHQAPYLIERGLSPTIAATVVSMFSLMSAVGSIACGMMPRRFPIRYGLALAGASIALGTGAMLGIHSAGLA